MMIPWMSDDSTSSISENLSSAEERYSAFQGKYLFGEVINYITSSSERPILEIGGGMGHSSLFLLSQGPSQGQKVTTIERDSNNIDNLSGLKDIFDSSFNYHICSSTEYDIDNDPDKDNYILTVIDGTVTTLSNDLQLARSTSSDVIWLLNTSDSSVVDEIATEFYNSSNFTYDRNLRLLVCKDGNPSGEYVNTTLMRRG